jgi:uncharacterized membrane protein
LITNLWRTVPPGTNGGMSLIGTLASLVGGLFIGLAFYGLRVIVDSSVTAGSTAPQWPVVLAGCLAGLLGSLIDSLLGATLQFSGWSTADRCVVEQPGPGVQPISGWPLLDNHQVNLLSCLLTALLTPLIMGHLL